MLNPADDGFLARLHEILPAVAFREGEGYLTEPRGRWQGQGQVVAPSSTEEVAAVVRLCADAQVGIVP